MRICLDFDGVIHDPTNREPGYRMGKPAHGALEAVWQLVRDGHTVMVHTCRAQVDANVLHVVSWLAYFGFPEMHVFLFKPRADVYVDDKALRFVDWAQANEALDHFAQG